MNTYIIEFFNDCLKKPGTNQWIDADSEQEAREKFTKKNRDFCKITKITLQYKRPTLTWSYGEAESLNGFYSGIDAGDDRDYNAE